MVLTSIAHRFLLVAALLVGAALRLPGLDRQSFWTDELYVVWEARQPLGLIFNPDLHIHHPPGYRLALHGWLGLGLSEGWIRLLPAISGLLLILVVWLLARALWPSRPWAASASALLAATSPFLIHYGQDATSYSWAALWVSVSVLLLVVAWRKEGWWLWAAWGASLAVALYTHYFALFPLVAEAVAVLVAGLAGGVEGRKQLLRAALAIGLGALLFAPWVWRLFTGRGDSFQIFYFPLTVDDQSLRWVPVLLAGYARPAFWTQGTGLLLVWALLIIAFTWGSWRIFRSRRLQDAAGIGLLVLWGVAAIVGPYAFLRLATPPDAVDPVRFAALAAPALLLGLGAFVASLPIPLRLLGLAGWLVVAGAQWQREVTSPPTQDWRGVMQTIAAEARQDDVLLAFPAFHAGAAAAYYTIPVPVQGGWFLPEVEGERRAAYWFPEGWRWRGFLDTDAVRDEDLAAELVERAARGERLWYLAGDGSDGTYPPSLYAERALITAGWREARVWNHSPLVLKLFER